MPTVVEVRSGRGSDSTRTPLASRVACMRLPLRLLLLRLLERFLAGQPDLSRLVHLEHLDRDDVALLEHVGDLAHALVGELRDVHQAVRAGEDLHEGPEVDDLAHRAAVDLAHLGLRGDAADVLARVVQRCAVGGSNQHRAVVLHVDLDRGLLGDAADHLAPRADQVAHAVRLDVDGDDARRVHGELAARTRERLVHDAEDVEPRPPRVLERLLHDGARHAGDLDVHLHRGDARLRARDLEVHVAEVVLVTEDVGEDAYLVALPDEPHGHAGDRRLDGHATVHERERAAAYGGHGGGAVRLEDLRDDADGVGEVLLAREDRRERALGERPVADLAPPGAAQELDLARAERREVVVQHELLVGLANERIDLLLVGGGTERRDHERLRLAAREEGRAVRAWQDLDLAGDGAHVGEPAAVEAALLLHDRLADDVLLQVIEEGGDLLQPLGGSLAEARHHLVARLIERVVALLLAGLGECGAEAGQRRLAHLPLERGVDGGRRHAALGLADQPLQTLLQRDERLQRLVRGEERLEQQRLGDHTGAALDHDDRVTAARDDDVHVAGRELAGGRVDDEPAVQPPDAHGRDRAAPRDVGEDERSRGAEQGEDVGVVLPVVREHGGDHLGLAVEALREERTEGAVDQAGGEDLLLRRPALALEEAAGDLPGGDGLRLVVAGEGEEVDALARGGERRRRDKDDGLPELHEGGPPALLAHAAALDRQAA